MTTTPCMNAQLTAPDGQDAEALGRLLHTVESVRSDYTKLFALSEEAHLLLAPGRFNPNAIQKFRLCKSVGAALDLAKRTLPGWGYSVDATLAGAEIDVMFYPPGDKVTCGIPGRGATLPLAILAAVLRAVLASLCSESLAHYVGKYVDAVQRAEAKQ